ncbi:hypothetical protein QL285_045121 [Trifolium repens]|nr:hypothetical protein QL285_045121 [Trifolium repens]
MIDKSWINKPIKSKDYLNGAVQFLDFAFSNPECDGTILCPCSVCRFGYSEEAMLAGPVHYRWMYPVERSLGHLKSYVRNKAAPEGCIAEGYIVEECLTFCSRYLEDGDNGVSSSSESTILLKLFPTLGKPIGVTKIFSLPNLEMIQAHRYVLANCELVDPFHEKFKTEVTRMYRGKRNSTRVVEEYVHQHFHEWFKEYVARKDDFMDITSEIEWLAREPNNIARRFHGYNINGFKFRTEKKEQGLKTQNSGVVMSAITQKFSAGGETIQNSSNVMYYGKLVDIIELDYFGKLRVVLFKCIWVDTKLNKGIKIDHFGITSVNFSHLIHTGLNEVDEPFILATDARMVYYVDDPVDQGWSCVCHMKPRDIYDMGECEMMSMKKNYTEVIWTLFFMADNHLLQLMTTQVVVDEVWYLELQNLKLGETPLSLRKGK